MHQNMHNERYLWQPVIEDMIQLNTLLSSFFSYLLFFIYETFVTLREISNNKIRRKL